MLLTCLSVLPVALRAQGYQMSGGGHYHASSVYYVTLKDAAGEDINSQYAAVEGVIGAFVGDELRGISQWQSTGKAAGQGIFIIRVWGNKDDASTATFRLCDKQGLEYQIGSQAFSQDEEGTYGSPSAPITFTVSTVTGISLPSTEITLLVGETQSVQPELQPANHSTLLTTMKYAYSSNNAAFTVSEDGIITAIAEGQGTLTVKATPGNFTAQATVKVSAVPMVTLGFASKELTVSKLYDATLTLTKEGTAAFLPSRVELVFSKAANGEPVATATMADETGLKWTLRGQYVGKHTVKIKYNGKEQSASCGINVPAEYPIQQGWGWMSFYAISNKGVLPLMTNDNWKALIIDEDNLVADIRTQQHVLHYDPKYGFLGNLIELRADEGMFKMRGDFSDDHAGTMVINVGYNNLLLGSNLPNPKVKKGYTWVNYPHEISHHIDVLNTYLKKTAAEGDLIIARNGFAEFDGEEWISEGDFTFTPGNGYIYFTESTVERSIDWGPATLGPDPAPARSIKGAEYTSTETIWNYNPYLYPDCMPIVAQLDGITDPENYSVGAFVGDECRGRGEAASNGLMYIAVSGERGDKVSFRLYHKPTAMFIGIEGTGLSFTQRAGNYRNPIVLRPDMTTIGHAACDLSTDNEAVYNLQGRRITSVKGSKKGLYITTVTEGGHRVTRKIISK